MKIFKKSYWRFKRETRTIYNLVIATGNVHKNSFFYVPDPRNVKDNEDLLRVKIWMNRMGLIFIHIDSGYRVMWFDEKELFYHKLLAEQKEELEKERFILIETKRGLRRESGVIDE